MRGAGRGGAMGGMRRPMGMPPPQYFENDCRLTVVNLPSSIDADELKKTLSEYGNVINCTINYGRGMANIIMDSPESAERVINAMDFALHWNRRLRVFFTSTRDKGVDITQPIKATQEPSEGRCRLFVGNLPANIQEDDLKTLFSKFGTVSEVFVNTEKNFAFLRMNSYQCAEQARKELDNSEFKGKQIQVRFATHGLSIRVTRLHNTVTNELLHQAFSMFGEVERAIVVTDERGKPTGEGIVEFARKQAATCAIDKCTEGAFLLTLSPVPVEVEPLEYRDHILGLAERSVNKRSRLYLNERDAPPRFASSQNPSEYGIAQKWKEYYKFEKEQKEELERKLEERRRDLEKETEAFRKNPPQTMPAVPPMNGFHHRQVAPPYYHQYGSNGATSDPRFFHVPPMPYNPARYS